MQLAIFGLTGQTGKYLLEQSLAAGHEVSALVRSPEKLPADQPGLRVMQGDVRDAEQVARVVAGCQAVLSVLGPSRHAPDFVISQGVDNILAAMQAQAVRRLVISIGAGVRDPKDRPTWPHAFFGLLVKLLSRPVYDDMRRAAGAVRASAVDWTIVRVPRLTDAAGSGIIRCGYVGVDVGLQLSRADLALFMLRQVTDKTFIQQAPAISN